MKPNFLSADVANLEAHVHDLFAAYPELAEDEDLRRDMLEGETDAFSVLTRLLAQEREADSLAAAVAARVTELGARKARAERKKAAMRALMLRVMKATGLQKAGLVEATVSVGKGRDSVEITDEAALPKWAVRTKTEPDKKAIAERLADGKAVKGARMKTGEDTLSVRVG